MLNLTRRGNNIPENIEKSRMGELKEAVKNLSQKAETLLKENIMLYEKSEKCDTWVIRLIGCCKEMVRRVEALEKKCSTLPQELDPQNLHLDALSMTISVEGKSLNNDSFIIEMLQIQALHISELPETTMYEFAAAMDELTVEMEGAHKLEPEHRDVPSCDMNARLEPIATIPTRRERKAQEMKQSGPDTPSPPSSSYNTPITFLNTISD